MAGLIDLLCPDEMADRVEDIDCGALSRAGIKLIILDLDNTLLPWKSSEVPDGVRKWVEQARSAGMKLAILSNTHYPRRLGRIAGDLGIPSIAHAGKPFRRGFLKAARLAECRPDEAVVVGDQLFTDMLGGNLAGMRTILVRPVDSREFAGTKLSRALEKLVMPRIRARAAKGTKPGPFQSQTKDAK